MKYIKPVYTTQSVTQVRNQKTEKYLQNDNLKIAGSVG